MPNSSFRWGSIFTVHRVIQTLCLVSLFCVFRIFGALRDIFVVQTAGIGDLSDWIFLILASQQTAGAFISTGIFYHQIHIHIDQNDGEQHQAAKVGSTTPLNMWLVVAPIVFAYMPVFFRLWTLGAEETGSVLAAVSIAMIANVVEIFPARVVGSLVAKHSPFKALILQGALPSITCAILVLFAPKTLIGLLTIILLATAIQASASKILSLETSMAFATAKGESSSSPGFQLALAQYVVGFHTSLEIICASKLGTGVASLIILCQKPIELLVGLTGIALSHFLIPRILARDQTSPDKPQSLLKPILVAGVSFASLVIIFAQPVGYLYSYVLTSFFIPAVGPQFSGLFSLLCFALLPHTVNQILGAYLIGQRLSRSILFVCAIMTVMTYPFYTVLLSFFGTIGFPIARFLLYSAWSLVSGIILYRNFNEQRIASPP